MYRKFCPRDRQSNRTFLVDALERVTSRNRRTFTEAISLYQSTAGQLFKLILYFERQRGATRYAITDRGKIVFRKIRRVVDARIDGRHRGKHCWSLLVNSFQCLLKFVAGQQNHLGACGDRKIHDTGHCKYVEQGQYTKHLLLAGRKVGKPQFHLRYIG